jgi:hypothetical protein
MELEDIAETNAQAEIWTIILCALCNPKTGVW